MVRGKTLLFSITATLLALAALEGVARLLVVAVDRPAPERGGFVFEDVWAHADDPVHAPDRELFWRPVPGRVVGNVRINREGCRGPDFAIPKPDGVRRLVLAGDSVTFGYGVAEEESFAGRLRHDLAPGVEVIDAGVTGYSSWQGRKLLEAQVRRWQPDVVVVLFGYNDHHSAAWSDRQKYARRHLEEAAHVASHSAIFQVASRAGAALRPARASTPVARVPLDEFEANLLAIDATCRAAGARALFLTVPIRPVLPLVENFVAVRDPADPAGRPVWVRQVDFACQQMGEPASSEIAAHFFDGEGLAAFVSRPADCERIAALAALAPELPIFHYLRALCLRERDPLGSERAWRECQRLDRERDAMEGYSARLRTLGAAGRLEVWDLAAHFAAQNDAALFLDVVHPNARGHALAAAAIASWVPFPSAPRP